MLFYNILTIPKLQRSDRGLYTCRVTSGEKTKEQRVNVTVFGERLPLKLPYSLMIQQQTYAEITSLYLKAVESFIL